MDRPLRCLPFSPNWFSPQIFSQHKNLFAFGSNNDVFIIDSQSKSFYQHLYQQENKSQSKVTSMSFLQKYKQQDDNYYIIVGYSDGQILLFKFNQNTFSIEMQFQISHTAGNIQYVIDISSSQDYITLLIANDCGFIWLFDMIDIKLKNVKLLYKPQYSQQQLNSQQKKKIKYLQFVEQFQIIYAIYEQGKFIILDLNGKILKESIQQNTLYLYCDIQKKTSDQDQVEHDILLITKQKYDLKIEIYQLSIQLNDNIDKNDQKIQQQNISPNLNISYQSQICRKIEFNYPKQKPELNFQLEKASLAIKYLNQHSILVTGKQGEFYQINIQKMKQNQSKIQFKPFSSDIQLDLENAVYEVLPEQYHSKCVYEIFKIENQSQNKMLVSLSIDRSIAFIDIEEADDDSLQGQCFLSKQWYLNCLGSKVSVISNSPVEPELLFFCCADNSIKTWDFTKKNNTLYVSDFGKNLQIEQKIQNMWIHPTDEGVITLLLEDRATLIWYNIYQEEIIGSLVLIDKVLNYQWMEKQQLQILEQILQDQFEQEQQENENGVKSLQTNMVKASQYNPNPKQPISSYYFCFITLENNIGVIISPNNQFKLINQFPIYNKNSTLESENTKITAISQYFHSNNHILVSAFQKQLKIVIAQSTQQNNISQNEENIEIFHKIYQTIHQNNIRAVSFKAINEGQVLLASGGFDRKINLFLINLNDNRNIIYLGQLKHKYPVVKLKFSESKFYLLSVCHNHDTVQIYDIGQLINEIPKIENKGDNEQTENPLLQQNILEAAELCNIRGHKGYINDAEFCPQNPDVVITSSDDQTVKFWNIYEIKNKKVPNKQKKNKQKNNINTKRENPYIKDQKYNISKGDNLTKKIQSEENDLQKMKQKIIHQYNLVNVNQQIDKEKNYEVEEGQINNSNEQNSKNIVDDEIEEGEI